MMQFKAFKPEAMNKIAKAMGYQGDMSQFQQFVEGDPQRQAQMQRYTNKAMQMAKGGMVKQYNTGGNVSSQNIGQATTQRMYTPAVPVGGVTQAAATPQTQAPSKHPFQNRCRY
jgi:hypothetical protein